VDCTLELIHISTETQAFESTYVDGNLDAGISSTVSKAPRIPIDDAATSFVARSATVGNGSASDSDATDPGAAIIDAPSPFRSADLSLSVAGMTPFPPSTMDTVLVDDEDHAEDQSNFEEASPNSLSEEDVEVEVVTQTPNGTLRSAGEPQEVVVAIAPMILGMFEEIENESVSSQQLHNDRLDAPSNISFSIAPEEIAPSSILIADSSSPIDTTHSAATAEQRDDREGDGTTRGEIDEEPRIESFHADLTGVITASTAEQLTPKEIHSEQPFAASESGIDLSANAPSEGCAFEAERKWLKFNTVNDVAVISDGGATEKKDETAVDENRSRSTKLDHANIDEVGSHSTHQFASSSSSGAGIVEEAQVERTVEIESITNNVIAASTTKRGGRAIKSVLRSRENVMLNPDDTSLPCDKQFETLSASELAAKKSTAVNAVAMKDKQPTRATRGVKAKPSSDDKGDESALVRAGQDNQLKASVVVTAKPTSRARGRGAKDTILEAMPNNTPYESIGACAADEDRNKSDAADSKDGFSGVDPSQHRAPEDNAGAPAPSASSRSKRKEPEPSGESSSQSAPVGRPTRRHKSDSAIEEASPAISAAVIETARPKACYVMFSGIEPLPALAKRIGATIVDEPSVATHVVTMDNTIKRTVKLMTALNRGVLFVVGEKWLQDSAKAGKPVAITDLASSPYIVTDAAREHQWGFRLSDTLALPRGPRSGSNGRLVFADLLFYFTPAVFKSDRVPPQADMRAVVESGGGTWLESLPKASSSSSGKKKGTASVVDLTSLLIIVLPPSLRDSAPPAKRSKGSDTSSASSLLSEEELVCLRQSSVARDSRGRSLVFYPEMILIACLRQRLDLNENSEVV
jgi:hypothetical protein